MVSATHVGLVGAGGGVNSVTGQNAMMGVGGGLGSGSGGGSGSDHMNDNSSNDKLLKSGVQTSPDGKLYLNTMYVVHI